MSQPPSVQPVPSHLEGVDTRVANYPRTRFMGSKRKILPFIRDVVSTIPCDTVLDAFSGSGVVAYLFKALGKRVTTNDFMAYCYRMAAALVANEGVTLSPSDVEGLLAPKDGALTFIRDTFRGMYFGDDENALLDRVSANIWALADETKRSLALAALCRACLKKTPRGVFTVYGPRYDDGRRDLRISLEQHFREAVDAMNRAVFTSGKRHRAVLGDVTDLPETGFDLVYLDPPYLTPHSDNDYIRRYHFVEGLATYWRGVEILPVSRTKRIGYRPSPFGSRATIHDAFRAVFARFRASTLLVSYSSNSIPARDEMVDLLREAGKRVDVYACDHTYSFGTHAHRAGSNRNAVREYLFVGW